MSVHGGQVDEHFGCSRQVNFPLEFIFTVNDLRYYTREGRQFADTGVLTWLVKDGLDFSVLF